MNKDKNIKVIGVVFVLLVVSYLVRTAGVHYFVQKNSREMNRADEECRKLLQPQAKDELSRYNSVSNYSKCSLNYINSITEKNRHILNITQAGLLIYVVVLVGFVGYIAYFFLFKHRSRKRGP